MSAIPGAMATSALEPTPAAIARPLSPLALPRPTDDRLVLGSPTTFPNALVPAFPAAGEDYDAAADGDADVDADGEPDSDYAPENVSLSPPPPVNIPLGAQRPSHSPSKSNGTANSKTPRSSAYSPSVPSSSSATSSAPRGDQKAQTKHTPITGSPFPSRPPLLPKHEPDRARSNTSRHPKSRRAPKKHFDPSTPLFPGQSWSQRNASVHPHRPDVKCAFVECQKRPYAVVRQQIVGVMPGGRLVPYSSHEEEEEEEEEEKVPSPEDDPDPNAPLTSRDVTSVHRDPEVQQLEAIPLMLGAERMDVVEVPEALEACHLCGSAGHASCLGWKEQAVWKLDIVRSYPWTCSECKRCEVCAKKPESEEEEATFLFCSCCDRAWHTHCVDLPDVPPGWWSCPVCAAHGLSNPPDLSTLTFISPTPSLATRTHSRRRSYNACKRARMAMLPQPQAKTANQAPDMLSGDEASRPPGKRRRISARAATVSDALPAVADLSNPYQRNSATPAYALDPSSHSPQPPRSTQRQSVMLADAFFLRSMGRPTWEEDLEGHRTQLNRTRRQSDGPVMRSTRAYSDFHSCSPDPHLPAPPTEYTPSASAAHPRLAPTLPPRLPPASSSSSLPSALPTSSFVPLPPPVLPPHVAPIIADDDAANFSSVIVHPRTLESSHRGSSETASCSTRTRIRLQVPPRLRSAVSDWPPSDQLEGEGSDAELDLTNGFMQARQACGSTHRTSSSESHRRAERTRVASASRAGDLPPVGGPNPFDGLLTPAQADMALAWPGAEDRAMFAASAQPAVRKSRAGASVPGVVAAPHVLATVAAATGAQPWQLLPISRIRFDGIEIETWFAAPLPDEYSLVPDGRMYLCGQCFKFMTSSMMACRHRLKCKYSRPPGSLVYSHGNVRIYEVDGAKNKMYCQNLCLLAKMFLDHKTMFYDVAPFLFYICVEMDGFEPPGVPAHSTDGGGAHFVGYFSKEKDPVDTYNLSCIMTLPIRQRKGWGNFLIDFSYHLSRAAHLPGSPEKPLSDLGALTYQRYWALSLARVLDGLDFSSSEGPSINFLAESTGMTSSDVLASLRHNGWIVEANTVSPSPHTGEKPTAKAVESHCTDAGSRRNRSRRSIEGGLAARPASPRARPTHRQERQERPERMPLCTMEDVEIVEATGYRIVWDAQQVRQAISKHDARGHVRLDAASVAVPHIDTSAAPAPAVDTFDTSVTTDTAMATAAYQDAAEADVPLDPRLRFQPVAQSLDAVPLAQADPHALNETLELLRRLRQARGRDKEAAPAAPGLAAILESPTPFPS